MPFRSKRKEINEILMQKRVMLVNWFYCCSVDSSQCFSDYFLLNFISVALFAPLSLSLWNDTYLLFKALIGFSDTLLAGVILPQAVSERSQMWTLNIWTFTLIVGWMRGPKAFVAYGPSGCSFCRSLELSLCRSHDLNRLKCATEARLLLQLSVRYLHSWDRTELLVCWISQCQLVYALFFFFHKHQPGCASVKEQ